MFLNLVILIKQHAIQSRILKALFDQLIYISYVTIDNGVAEKDKFGRFHLFPFVSNLQSLLTNQSSTDKEIEVILTLLC